MAVPASALAHGHEHGRDHVRGHDRLGMRDGTPGVAGRIVSHSGDSLTIAGLNGATATGTVTDDTKVFCIRHATTSDGAKRLHRDEGMRDAPWAGDSGFVIARCSPVDDLKPGRRIAGAELSFTPSGSVWRFVVVWD